MVYEIYSGNDAFSIFAHEVAHYAPEVKEMERDWLKAGDGAKRDALDVMENYINSQVDTLMDRYLYDYQP